MKKPYMTPSADLIEFSLRDVILASIIIPTEEWEPPILTKRPSIKDELEGDDLYEITE